jgi:hypothetical protein
MTASRQMRSSADRATPTFQRETQMNDAPRSASIRCDLVACRPPGCIIRGKRSSEVVRLSKRIAYDPQMSYVLNWSLLSDTVQTPTSFLIYF